MAFAFERLEVYQKAVAFADAACTPTQGFLPADQLNRAALSIATNPALGNGPVRPPVARERHIWTTPQSTL